ncbi:MAG TPA: serine hydrolase domain-containing protein [Gemmatimonadaceae bacterium]
MRRVALILLLAPSSAPAQQSTELGPIADRVFSAWNSSTPGCAVGVAKGGQTLLERGYGMANLETGTPNTAETIFESGSVAKQFTATAALLLMHDGKLRLDDLVQKYVPELPTYDRPITIRHLLSHTSGLREWSNLVAVAGWPRGSRVHTQNELLQTVFAQRSLNYSPGDYYSYTNSGFALLQTIVERVSGVPFARFSEERIFKPLGMTHTRWRTDYTTIVPGRAQAYGRRGSDWALNMPFENVVGPGGLLTTVSDWLIWNDALDNRTMGSWLVDSLESQATLTSGRKIRYAMGLVVSSYRGEREVAHSGSTGGYSTFLMRLPERRISVAVLCNGAGAPATSLARQMAAALLPAVSDAPAPDTVAAGAAVVSRISGVYRSLRTHEPLAVGVATGRGGRGGGTLRALRDGGFLVGNSRALVDRAPDGSPTGLRVLAGDGDTIAYAFAGAARWEPTAADLRAFEGEYRTEEIPATWTAKVEEGRLVLSVRPGARRQLAPAYANAFTSPGLGAVWFTRDAGGSVTAMHFGSGRLWDLELRRVGR